ncbi:MAG: ribonuclease II, partial [Treponema sp.]|nr:ribonuclease II [Treponema sp.]
MIKKNCLVLYKNKPALVTEEGEKITISVLGGDTLKVREKDIELIHPGPLTSLKELEMLPKGDVESAWELLEGGSASLKELAELVYDAYTPQSAWAAYLLMKDGLYFIGNLTEIKPREKHQIEEELNKRSEKEKEQGER